MQVSDVMTKEFASTKTTDNLVAASTKMGSLDIGALPVVDDENVLKGFVTDRDICIRGVAHGKDPNTTEVGSVMTQGPVACTSDTSVQDAARIMQDRQIRRLLVTEDGMAVGIVSLGDLAVKSTDESTAADTLEEVSKPAQPKT